jgi:hypothetical protein
MFGCAPDKLLGMLLLLLLNIKVFRSPREYCARLEENQFGTQPIAIRVMWTKIGFAVHC